VLNGIEAIVRRSIKERVNTIIEGVHLVPGEMGFLKKFRKEATIIEVMLDVKLKSKHQQHFQSRHLQNTNRKKERYMKFFKEIRLVRDFLVCQAEKNEVPVIENYDLRKAEQQILEVVYSHYFHK
jgi:2-phosphoglycerate kinase